MDLIIGADTGALKAISLAANVAANCNEIEKLNPKTDGVACLSYDATNVNVLCARLDRSLSLFECSSGKFTDLAKVGEATSTAELKSLSCLDGSSLLTGESDGVVKIFDIDENRLPTLKRSFNSGSNLKRARHNPTNFTEFATCGHGNLLKVWDVESTEKAKFIAKNPPNDWLRLKIPMTDNDLQFIPDSPLVVTCTGTKELRLYDPRAQRKPVMSIKHGEYPFSSIDLPRHDGSSMHRVVAGTTHGNMGLFDWRTKNQVHVYKGFQGAIRDIRCHSTRPLVASCSLDRFTRVHDIDKNTQKCKIYCKARLTCLLWRERKQDPFESIKQGKIEMKNDEELSNGDKSDQEDEIWNNMKTIASKRKDVNQDENPPKRMKFPPTRKRKQLDDQESASRKIRKTKLMKKRKSNLNNDVENKKAKVIKNSIINGK